MKRLAVLVSGSGTNLQAIIDSIKSKTLNAEISLVVSNKKNAYGLTRAKNNNIPSLYHPYISNSMDREEYDRTLASIIKPYNPDYIVCAGWMHILSSAFLSHFPQKVINLHPALPGKFPGKDSIKTAFDYYKEHPEEGNKHTGIMVHYVDEGVDTGSPISILKVPIYENDTLDELRTRVTTYEKNVLLLSLQTLVNNTSPKSFEMCYQGKVRDVYELNDNMLAMVQTTRQSAFDRQICLVPYKDRILTETSAWWFKKLENELNIKSHYVNHHDNIMFVKKCQVIPIEVVVRSYITGSTKTSLWVNYKNGCRDYCGHFLMDGYVKNQKLPKNIVTPTTKGVVDIPISGKEIVEQNIVSREEWDFMEKTALRIFEYGQRVAASKGLILVDTKYEFGYDENGEIILIDEVHTCDSSRYWKMSSYMPNFSNGKEPEKFDKDIVRDYIKANCDDPYKQLPDIPDSLIEKSQSEYMKFFETLTGEPISLDNYENKTITKQYLKEVYANFVNTCVILSGSEKDEWHVSKIRKFLNEYNIHTVEYVSSAHKKTEEVLSILRKYRGKNVVYVTVAGRSNALSGVVAANTRVPVIACPPFRSKDDMNVNIHSTLQCPSFVPVMAVLEPLNVALCISRIFSV